MSEASQRSSVDETALPADSDKPTRYARKAIVASVVGYAMDGFDLLILGFAMSAIIADLSLSNTQGGSLATITLVGAVLGGIVFGVLSDYFGRVRMLTWSIIIFAVFTGMTAIAGGFTEIAVYRFLAGIGLGGEFGIGMTLAAEAWPAKLRARATSVVGLGFQGGVLLAALISAPVIALWGWRGLFLIGALPALIAFVMRAKLHEPELYTENKKEHTGKRTFPLKLLFVDGQSARSSIGLFVLTSVQNFGYYGIMIWLPTYLATQFGYGLTQSGVWMGVTILGMAIGIVTFGWLADTIGRRRSFWIFQAGAAVSVLAYSQLTTPMALLIGGAVMGAFANGMLGGYGALMAELYPTEARATAQNVLFNMGRAVGGFAPVVVALVAGAYGFPFAIGLLSVIYIADMGAMLLIPERRAADLA
jgi:benzoate transport